MKKAILAKKIGMTQINLPSGEFVGVTVLEAGPCVVTQVKTKENDGYEAVQIGFGEIREKLVNKPEMGLFKKDEIAPLRKLAEFRYESGNADLTVGSVIKADVFAVGDHVDVSGISKGKGYQGAIHRWGLSRGPMKHGSKYHRHAGSMGASSDPSRVYKGKKLPGHMGNVKCTVQNLEIVRVDADQNLILVKGSVPGAKKSVVRIFNTTRA